MNTNEIPNLGRTIHVDEFVYLHKQVLLVKPKLVVESGTFLGTGSTLAIATALQKLGRGVLKTYEINEIFCEKAKEFYKSQTENFGFVKVICENFVEVVKVFKDETYGILDLLFLDGGDEDYDGAIKELTPEICENLISFKILEPNLNRGTHVLLHDWDFGRGLFIQNYLKEKNFDGWELVKYFDGYNGMAHLIRIKDANTW